MTDVCVLSPWSPSRPPRYPDAVAADLDYRWEKEGGAIRLRSALYYEDRPGWIRMMKQVITKIGPYYNSHRMMRRYAADAYIR